jgi:hypothetical protein
MTGQALRDRVASGTVTLKWPERNADTTFIDRGATMATKQTSSGSGTRKTEGARGAVARKGDSQTGERDEHYDIISVLYHSLQGAETCEQYISDARNARDQELLSFFEETRAEYAARAAQAKEMLATRLEGGASGMDDEDVDEDDEDED